MISTPWQKNGLDAWLKKSTFFQSFKKEFFMLFQKVNRGRNISKSLKKTTLKWEHDTQSHDVGLKHWKHSKNSQD